MKTVILAAGAGTRMKSDLPKCLHKILGHTMIEMVVETAIETGTDELIVVTGHGGETLKEALLAGRNGNRCTFVVQQQQLGTGHAVSTAAEHISPDDTVLVLYGDTPLIRASAIAGLIEKHKSDNNAVTVLSTFVNNPYGYGRIISDCGHFERITEQKDLKPEQMHIKEINTGIFVFDGKALLYALPKLSNSNASGEFYLTDTIEIINAAGLSTGVYCDCDDEQFMGINTKVQLAQATEIMKKRINEQHMLNGVTMIDPSSCYISPQATIGADTVLYPGVIIEGDTTIGKGCMIGPNTRISDCRIHDDVEIMNSVLTQSSVDSHSHIGPFAYLRPHSHIGKHCRIGDFVEIKNATLGDKSKAAHLTYIGDAEVGSGVNFGCGTITGNYDGQKKYKTVVEDNVFIGCNTNLVAPLTIKRGAYIAAGSTITKDVPEDTLAIARSCQVLKPEWEKRKMEKAKQQ